MMFGINHGGRARYCHSGRSVRADDYPFGSDQARNLRSSLVFGMILGRWYGLGRSIQSGNGLKSRIVFLGAEFKAANNSQTEPNRTKPILLLW